jgi:uncharacterized protein YjlB
MRLETLQFQPTPEVPNNPALPVIAYRGVLAPGPDMAAAFEALFAANGWPPQWRDGIYPFHHYHSRGHEALACAAGRVRVLLGGPGGEAVEIAAGDVLLLPAGTGHCRLAATGALLIVGAYPPGQSGDIIRTPPTPEIVARIRGLPVPGADPVGAPDGVTARWQQGEP